MIISLTEAMYVVSTVGHGGLSDVRHSGARLREILDLASKGLPNRHLPAAILLTGVVVEPCWTSLDENADTQQQLNECIGVAFVLAQRQLALQGVRLPSHAVEESSFCPLIEGLLDGSMGVADVEQWLLSQTGADAAESQLTLDFVPPATTPTIRAYIASALTGLSPEEHADLMVKCNVIRDALAEDGIHVHVPMDYTDPLSTGDDPPDRASRIDFSAVIRSDLIVLIANRPSTGAGKELVWAERNGCMTLLVADPGTTPSRLVSGTTARLMEVAVSLAPGDLAAEIKGVVEAHRDLLEAHARERAVRPIGRFGDLLAQMEPLLPDVRAGLARGQVTGLTAERAAEMVSSVDHVATASLVEIDMYFLAAGVPPRIEEPPEPSVSHAEHLGPRELQALGAAAELENWSVDEVIGLLLEVQRRPTEVGVAYRRHLRDAEAWIDFRNGR